MLRPFFSLDNYSVDLVVSDLLRPNLNGYALTPPIVRSTATFQLS
jgi:hypothetical protein